MSEAMSSVEIEDVLSSIRRLVSEDLRPASRAAAPKADEKLLLTPAFRVVAAPAPQPAPQSPARPAPLPRLHLGVAAPRKDELVATLQRAVEAQDIEWESEVGDPLPPVARMEWTEDGWAATGEPDEINEAIDADMQPWDQTDPDQDGAALAFGTADHAEVHGAEPDDDWADQAEAEAVAQLQDDAPSWGEPDPQPADATDAPRPEDMIFDEQILRDLVRDLIREELQGDLGERITRNVRKLVRAEISRMIASQDLD